ncbi:MAG TPA: hypothetical protein VGE13_04605 [Candidatus Saccharimonadales bacterium]
MSRYTLLLLLNLPFIILAVTGVITQYKLKRSTRRKMFTQVSIWIIILIGLSLAQPLYEWLFAHNWTQTESLSLFDVIQITAIVFLIYVVNRLRAKTDVIERRLNDLHQETSIILSTKR